jgi:hypothetical protein
MMAGSKAASANKPPARCTALRSASPKPMIAVAGMVAVAGALA